MECNDGVRSFNLSNARSSNRTSVSLRRLVSTIPKPAAAKPSERLVPAVARAVRLLDALSQTRQPLSLADLARTLQLPKSSTHGLLATLSALDLVSRTRDGQFSLGPRPLAWSAAYTLQSRVVGAFEALVDEVPALAAETAMVSVLDGVDVVDLAGRPGRRALAVNFRVGERFPACCTASGKAMLATRPPAQVRALLANGGLRRLTRHSVGSPTALARQLREVAERGWALDDEETAEGMHCFGAPVFAAGQDEAVAAVAVSAIKSTATPRRVHEIVASICALARQLTLRLGGTPHHAWPRLAKSDAAARVPAVHATR